MVLHLSQLQCFNTFSQVAKSCRRKKAKRKKGVEKSLYGERDIASKKPLLSPIPELPEVSEMSPSVPRVQRMFSGIGPVPVVYVVAFLFTSWLLFHSFIPFPHMLG